METTRNPGPFRLSGITPTAGFMVGDGLPGTVGVPGTIEVQIIGHGTGAISGTNHRRMGPR
jgi:hypothetical protein